jgi:hypothetical protein
MPYILHDKGADLAPLTADGAEYLGTEMRYTIGGCYDRPVTVLTVLTFSTRQEAFEALTKPTDLRATHELTFVPSYAERHSWRDRERGRFRPHGSGGVKYHDVPWAGYVNRYHAGMHEWYMPFVDLHYAHLSVSHPGLIAYTPDDEHGYNDKQTRLKPGVYLERFAPQLSVDVKAQYIAQIKASCDKFQLAFTSDPDVIERVYRGGPSSCMSHDDSDYASSVHPVRAYGHSPDLQLAYYGDPDHASGRAIVWPERKIHSCVYGDTATMRVLLEKLEYTEDDLDGARILAIEEDNGTYLMPYVDGAEHATKRGKYLVFGSGSLSCRRTDGLSGEKEPENTCERCERAIDEEGSLCSRCADLQYYCSECDEYYFTDQRDSEQLGDRTLCSNCADALRHECALCDNEWFDEDEFTDEEIADRTRRHVDTLCETCAADTQRCADDHCACYFDLSDTKCPDCDLTVRCEHTGDLLTDTPAEYVTVQTATADRYKLEVRHEDWQPCYFSSREVPAVGPLSEVVAYRERLQANYPHTQYRIVPVLPAVAAATEMAF